MIFPNWQAMAIVGYTYTNYLETSQSKNIQLFLKYNLIKILLLTHIYRIFLTKKSLCIRKYLIQDIIKIL